MAHFFGPHRTTSQVFESENKKWAEGFGRFRLHQWSRQQESNLHLALRRHSFYPLNYGEGLGSLCDSPLPFTPCLVQRGVSLGPGP